MIERSFHRMSDMGSDDERDGTIIHLQGEIENENNFEPSQNRSVSQFYPYAGRAGAR